MITVIMAINRYDGYCPKAIESILNQTMREIELLIVANGPNAEEIESRVLKICKEDSRVKVILSAIGQLAHALNVGIEHASYGFIARMDADDISHASRLERQLHYLRDKDLDMVGCNAHLIDENDRELGTRKCAQGSAIANSLPFKNPFIHPSILIKKEVLIKARGYNAGFNSEDYDLWLRLRRMRIKWDNIDEELLQYRIHSNSSQRKLLGYAECTGYALREFILFKSWINLSAIFFHFAKALFRSNNIAKSKP